jgi:hypothetical protein
MVRRVRAAPPAKDYSVALTIVSKHSGEVIETAYSEGGSSYRVGRTAMSTKNGNVVPKANRHVGQLPQALSQASGSGRALLGWTRFGSPGILG